MRKTIFAMTMLVSAPIMAMEAIPSLVPVPADNPMSTAKIELGKQLYFDPRLSIDGTVSCNSCHNVMAGGTDSRATSVGINGQRGGRNAPTVWNAAFLSTQFWDGRAATLEDQAKGPPLNPIEMGMPSEQAVVDRLSSIPGYKAQFDEIFGGVSYDNMAKAIASYERTLITINSRFDRYQKGDKNAMSQKAINGMKRFEEIGCAGCHSGINFAGPSMETGKGFFQKFPSFDSPYTAKYKLADDKGRYEVTKDKADINVWRVPSLRNIANTAPYFHNGEVKMLSEAVRVMASTQLERELSSKEVGDIVAFLKSLSGEYPAQSMPRLPGLAGVSMVGSEK
jgi:cytochrome c peroxidase